MSIKWIGAILVIAGCGGVGFMMAFQYRREIQMLRQLEGALEYMINELKYRQTPLPQLIKSAAGQCNSVLRGCLNTLSGELESQISPDAVSCMKAALAKTKDMPSNVRETLMLLGSTLGVFDLEGQLSDLRSVQTECGRRLAELENNKPQRLRSYQTLGLCAGAALAIIFV